MRKNRGRRKKLPVKPERTPPAPEQQWYNQQVSNNGNIPAGLADMSAFPEQTLAGWLRANCRFAD